MKQIVYGNVRGGLVFLPIERAAELARIQNALAASTWGELRVRMSPAAYDEFWALCGAKDAPSFEEFLEQEIESRPGLTKQAARLEYDSLETPTERQPHPSDVFTAGDIGVICDGDWPGWPAQEMLTWVPTPIQEQFGSIGHSMVSGACVDFGPEDEQGVVVAFESFGFSCTRNDRLVWRAHGVPDSD